MARPLGAGPFPGVVVIHHMPGWDASNKEIARRFAHHGYVAILPNLHYREGKATPEANSASIREKGGMPDERTMGDVQAAIDRLRELPYLNGKIGVIGYCSGGRQAYLAGCTLEGVDAVVSCYGGGVAQKPQEITPQQPVAPIDLTKDMQCPILGLFGIEDKRPSPEDAKKTEEALKKHGRTYSSTRTRTPATRSLPSIVSSIACMRHWTAGSACSAGSGSICSDSRRRSPEGSGLAALRNRGKPRFPSVTFLRSGALACRLGPCRHQISRR